MNSEVLNSFFDKISSVCCYFDDPHKLKKCLLMNFKLF